MAINKLVEEYNRLYSHLPDDEDELENYIRDKYKVNQSKVDKLKEIITNTEWKTIHLVLPIVPKPTPRPRTTSDGHMYVKGAADHKKFFQAILEEKKIIYTIAKIDINVYIPIPSSMNSTEMLLAQQKYIRPIGSGDWDNIAKTYCDMMQGVLISNDNIIIEGTLRKFYSLKPKVEITLEYQDGFDYKYNQRKITSSKAYKTLINPVKLYKSISL